MTQSLANKMQLIAAHVGDLNAQGKVRAMTGNERGYAKIYAVTPGCKVWAHHTLDDRLIIDLMITKSSTQNEPRVAQSAVATFERIARSAGYEVKPPQNWQHSINKEDTRQQHFINVSDKSTESITVFIDSLRTTFRQLPSAGKNEA